MSHLLCAFLSICAMNYCLVYSKTTVHSTARFVVNMSLKISVINTGGKRRFLSHLNEIEISTRDHSLCISYITEN